MLYWDEQWNFHKSEFESLSDNNAVLVACECFVHAYQNLSFYLAGKLPPTTLELINEVISVLNESAAALPKEEAVPEKLLQKLKVDIGNGSKEVGDGREKILESLHHICKSANGEATKKEAYNGIFSAYSAILLKESFSQKSQLTSEQLTYNFEKNSQACRKEIDFQLLKLGEYLR